MQHHYAFVIIKVGKAITTKVPKIIEEELNNRIAIQNELKEMSFEESIDFVKKRKVSEYSKLLKVLAEEIEKPLKQYSEDAAEGSQKFENWNPEDVFTPTELIDGFDTIEYFPEAVITPDYKWVEMGWSENEKENEEILKEWNRYIIRILSDHEEDSLVLVIHYDN